MPAAAPAVAAAVPIDQTTARQLRQQLPTQSEDPFPTLRKDLLAQGLACKESLQEGLGFTYLEAEFGEDIVCYSSVFAPSEDRIKVSGNMWMHMSVCTQHLQTDSGTWFPCNLFLT